MSFAELIYRILQQIQKRKEKLFDRSINWDYFPYKPAKRILNIVPNQIHYPETIEIFGMPLVVNEMINWHRDLYSGKEFPLIFSKDIVVQSEKYGSAKHVWEINRLLFLPQICLNYVNTKDEQYLNLFMRITQSWIRENPYLTGINWYSNIEVNIRLINWFFCWEILNVNMLLGKNERFNEFTHKEWLSTIYAHCVYAYNNPSKFSSANNHLIAEYAGLFMASSLWQFKESARWNKYAKKGLEKEILNQHSENGINKEEAAEYIQFITDFFLLSYVTGEKTNNRFSAEYIQMLRSIFTYIMHFTDKKGNFPRYGDEDDGRVISFNKDHRDNNFRSLLTSASIVFNDSSFKVKSNGFDAKNHILFGKEGEAIYNAINLENKLWGSAIYPKEGHFILRKQTSHEELYVHFDAAGLGYLSIAAHGHADALSFILHMDGKEIFTDPGTFSYHTDPRWRQYFIGTLAHNTIRINRKNQAANGGPTLWLNHYHVKVIEATIGDTYDKIIASHNGYEKEGIVHTREVFFNKTDQVILITDHLECLTSTSVFIEFPLHLHPDMQPFSTDWGVDVYNRKQLLFAKVIPDTNFSCTIVNGLKEPILGWYSGSFYRKETASVIYQSATISSSTTFKTTIRINR